MKNLVLISSIAIMTSCGTNNNSKIKSNNSAQSGFEGKILLWEAGEKHFGNVTLPDFEGGVFANRSVKFAALPSNMVPDESGCFCYSSDDVRFAYVQAYYFATNQLQYMTNMISELGYSPLPQLEITLENATTGNMPSGHAGDRSVTYRMSDPELDYSILAHEVGHFIHFNLPTSPDDLVGGISDGGYREWTTLLMEGAANFMSATYTGVPTIGFSYYDAPVSITKFVRFPDLVPTTKDFHLYMINAPVFSQMYPSSKKALSDFLNLIPPEGLQLPSPYSASAAVNAPMWIVSQRFGKDVAMKLYIHSLLKLKKDATIFDFGSALIDNASDPQIRSLLSRELEMRGVAKN